MVGITRRWSSRYVFIIASIGSTVGLFNIWKFTYLVGENGGGAFVFIYLLSLLIMGVPVLTSELMLGKIGGGSMVGSMLHLSEHHGFHRRWQVFGWVGALTVFLILSFYCVIAGLTIDYTYSSLVGDLDNMNNTTSVDFYNQIMADPLRLIFYQGLFVLFTTLIVARGVSAGLEKSAQWMMPGLFFILVGLLIYSAITADIGRAFQFMFLPDFSKITPVVALTAFGQAFLSLGIGLGVMLTYGAYMPEDTSIPRSAFTIAFADGLVAIIAGLAIFPIVFTYGLTPAEGPGLIFMTLPIAFSQMPGGSYVGSLFFVLLALAALSSSISLLESVISRFEEIRPGQRKFITYSIGFLLWVIGWLTVFSFNIWSDVKPLADKTIFELIDYVASNVIMPIGGLLMAVVGGWLISSKLSRQTLDLSGNVSYQIWHFLVRYFAPVVGLLIFLWNL